MQRVTSGVGAELQLVEDAINGVFLPALLQGVGGHIPVQEVTQLPVKHSGLALSYPTLSAPDNWTVLCIVTVHLVYDIWGQTGFQPGYHVILMKEGRVELRRQNNLADHQSLAEVTVALSELNVLRLQRETKTVACISIQPYTVDRSELGDQ